VAIFREHQDGRRKSDEKRIERRPEIVEFEGEPALLLQEPVFGRVDFARAL